jgi:hypothetical protein
MGPDGRKRNDLCRCQATLLLMRANKIITILAGGTLVAFALSCLATFKSKPSISMGVLRYVDSTNRWFPAAVLGLTNSGTITVRWDHVSSDEPNLLRTESRTGWVSKVFLPVGGVTVPPMLLEPGSNLLLLVPFSEGTLHWQLRYTIHGASPRDRIGNELTGGLGDRLYGLCRPLLSTNEGPPQAFWSEVFEIPSGMEAPTRNRNKLGSDAPPPEP